MPPCAVSLGPASISVNEAADWVDKKTIRFYFYFPSEGTWLGLPP
jgi:hypothetical protein